MNTTTFNSIRDLVYQKSGIAINENKGALVQARIGKRMRELNMDNAQEYLDRVLNDNGGDELVQLIDVISTNVTSFFRENDHFDFLGETVAIWQSRGQKRFRFWSAASSSGEEPYSIAMSLLEKMNCNQADIKILATDISTRILKKAQDGIYSTEKVEGIPSDYQKKYLQKNNTGKGSNWEIRDMVKSLVTFSRINLSTPPFPMTGPMDAVFCRNVMIYFDNTVRTRLLNDIFRLLKPGGYLFVGHAESLTGILSGFKAVKPSVYIKG